MGALLQDARFALRQLQRAPGFTATAVVTLMLAIGATSAMVSVLRATLLNPTPYPGAAQLVSISDINLKGFKTNGLVTVARAADLAEAPAVEGRGKLLASSAFYYFDQPTLIIAGHAPIATTAAAASGEFFTVLATAALLGHIFTDADDARGAPETAVISYGLWQRAFGADPAIVGRHVLLAGKATAIVGVMPQHFDYPAGAELWKPAHLFAQDFQGYRGSGTRFVNVIGRLADGTLRDAEKSTKVLAARLARSYPATDGEWGFRCTSVRSQILGSYREGVIVVSTAVGILLLIACANIAGLQLARNASRRPEMAIRRALGVSTPRLLQQLFTESLLLLGFSAALGVLLAAGLLSVLSSTLPPVLLGFDKPHLDTSTLLVTIAVTICAGLVCAVAPALDLGRTPALSAVAARTVAAGSGRSGPGLVTAQIALALVLVTLAAGLLQSLYRTLETPLGYQPTHVLSTAVHLPFGTEPAKVHEFVQQFEQRIHALPGIESAGAISALPLDSFMVERTADIFGHPPTLHHDAVSAEGRSITPDYLEAMQIPLLAGRIFTARDSQPGAPPVVLVNQSFAARYFPQRSAVGERLVFNLGADSGPRAATMAAEIIGVTGDVHGTGGDLSRAAAPEIDSPEDGGWPAMHFVVRTALPAATVEPALRSVLRGLEPGAALGPVSALADQVDHALAQPRLNSALLSGLAVLALVLVLVGVYGVIAFSVSQRTRELAVRLALGCSRSLIFVLLLRETGAMLAFGLLLGTGAALASGRVLQSSVASLHTPSLAMLAAASTLIGVAVLSAGLLPARRAALIDPATALRSE